MGNEFFFEGKKYISASRASQISGYNSDYIGQLCRKNLLDCRRVGRVWFVCEISLENHKNSASVTPRGRIPLYQKNIAEDAALIKASHIAIDRVGSKAEVAFHSPFQFEEAFIDTNKFARESRKFLTGMIVGVAAVIFTVFAAPSFLMTSEFVNPFSTISQKIGVLENTISQKISSAKTIRHDVVDTLAYSADVYASVGETIGQKFYKGFVYAYQGLAKLDDMLNGAVRQVRLAFSGSVSNDMHGDSSRTGVAVLPSAKNDAANDQVKKYVVDSFSDETQVIPDGSGNSGVLKPVFKERNDQEYLYVIVPVKDKGN